MKHRGLESLQKALNRVVRASGGRGRVEVLLGKKWNYVRNLLEGSMRLPQIYELLECLGVEPDGFMAKVFSREGITDWEHLRIGEDPDPKLTASFGELGASIDSASLAGSEQLTEDDEFAEVVRLEAERIDDERFSNPGDASKRARRLIDEVIGSKEHPVLRGTLASHVGGVLGSCYRIGADLRRAGWVFGEALRLAERVGARKQRAALLLRVSEYSMDRLDAEEALRVIASASECYSIDGDVEGIGKCCIHKGLCLHFMGEVRGAEKTFEAGLEVLSDELQLFRAAGLNGLALIAENDGRWQAAERYLKEAEACGLDGSHNKGMLTRIRGKIAAASGDRELALKKFRKARELLMPVNPVDAALVGIDEASILVEQGDLREAGETVRTLGYLIEPLSRVDEFAEQALSALVLTVYRGEAISRRSLEITRREIGSRAIRRAE